MLKKMKSLGDSKFSKVGETPSRKFTRNVFIIGKFNKYVTDKYLAPNES